ncbi:hypothetical protein ABG768_021769 [Culter alburnus]|uniref:BESS domain-containing protein n=1 Tax=Culter alburnus TaxID=194366 RepID=A0AAW2AVE9_CULAL
MESRDGDEQTTGYDRPDQAEAAAGLSETGEPADFLEGSEPGSPPPEPAAASPAQAGPLSAAAAVPTVPPMWRRRTPREEPINFEKELLASLRNRPQPSLCSEDEHFLLSLLPSLQKLQPQMEEFVKFQIHELIYESSNVLLNLETLEPTEKFFFLNYMRQQSLQGMKQTLSPFSSFICVPHYSIIPIKEI